MAAPVLSVAHVRQLRSAALRGLPPAPGARRAYRLPWPPSVNDYWKPVRNRLILTDRARDYRGAVAQAVVAVERRLPIPWSGKLRVVVELVPPDDSRLHDIDNTMKALLDALTKAHVWEDDSQVKRLEMDIDHAPARPGWVHVVIEAKA